MNQQQSKALELIEKAGLTQKHNQLIALGYANPWLNYRLLQRHSGNVEKVESALKVGENLRRDKELFAQSILTSKGWIEKNNELIKKGFTSMKKNLKVLLKSNGDLQQAEIKLMKKFRKRIQNDEPLDQILSRNGFKIQYEKLMEMGYGDSKKNLKLLFKYNGNLETILDILLGKDCDKMKISESSESRESRESRSKHKHKFGHHHHHSHHHPHHFRMNKYGKDFEEDENFHKYNKHEKFGRHGMHGRHGFKDKHDKRGKKQWKEHIQQIKQSSEYQNRNDAFKLKVIQLKNIGIPKHKAAKLIGIWNGDVDAVLNWLQNKQSTNPQAQPFDQGQPRQEDILIKE